MLSSLTVPTVTVPTCTFNGPLNVLAPDKVSVPAPVLENPLPSISALTVADLPTPSAPTLMLSATVRMFAPLPPLSTVQPAAVPVPVSPKTMIPIEREEARLTVISAVGSRVSKCAVLAAPVAMIELCQFAAVSHASLDRFVQVPSAPEPASTRDNWVGE